MQRASARRSRPGPSVLTPRPFTCGQVVKTSNSKGSAEALRKKHQHGKPSEDAQAAAPAASAAAAGGAPVGAATGGVGGETGAVGVGLARSIYASSVSEAQPASSSANGASFSTHSSSGSGGMFGGVLGGGGFKRPTKSRDNRDGGAMHSPSSFSLSSSSAAEADSWGRSAGGSWRA